MNGYLVRALVALLLAALLWAQARSAAGKPHRRRAYEMAAGALVAFAAYNATLAAGIVAGAVQIAVVVLGAALLAGAAISLAQSMYAGEMREQRDKAAAAAEEYRERHTKKE
jgi:hypothetical protein